MRKLIIFGDSISTINHGKNGYIERLINSNLFDNVKTFAISASGLTSSTPNNLYHLIDNCVAQIKNATHIIIWHGTNDWFYQVSSNTFLIELEEVYHKIVDINPTVDILLLTPIHRYEALGENSKKINGFYDYNKNNETLICFENIILEFCKNRLIDVINMRKSTPFNMSNMLFFYEDNIHPNEYGYYEISKIIINHYYKKFASSK